MSNDAYHTAGEEGGRTGREEEKEGGREGEGMH